MNTYEYSCYYGRDRDDWAKGSVNANSLDEAIKEAISELYGTGYNLNKSSVKITDNQ